MILADTSVWVDHLRDGNQALADRLEAALVLAHPFVIGELALGHLRQRAAILSALSDLPALGVATDAEVLCMRSSTTDCQGAASAMSTPIYSPRSS